MKNNKQLTLERVLTYFNEKEIVDILSDMIKIPSHKQVEWQEGRMADYVYNFLQDEEIKEVELDYIQENRPNVIAKLPGSGGGASLMLNGHLDTVPPYNMIIPAYDPVVRDGFIQGRGSVDMKGSLAAMLLAMVLIKRAGIELPGDLYFSGVIDQEQRSLGTVRLVEKNFKVDYAIVGEPTDLEICRAHKGMEWIKIIVKGKSAHGSTPEKGANTIYHACRIANEIEEFNKKLEGRPDELVGHPTINVGVIAGGDDPNIVPNVCCLEVDRRYTPDESREDIYEEIQRILTRLKTVYPEYQTEVISMDDRVCPLRNLPLNTDPENKLINSLKSSIKDFSGNEGIVTSFRGWSDAALLDRKLDIPSVVFGPGLPEKCHAADESLKITDLIRAVKIYLRTIIDICM